MRAVRYDARVRRWVLCLGITSACSGSGATAPAARAHDAAVTAAVPVDAAVAPFPARPSKFPSCSGSYAPRPDRDPSPMCYVRGGSYDVKGLGYAPKQMDHVQLDDFLIDQHEVTVEQFVKFLNDAWHVDRCGNPKNLCLDTGTPGRAPPVVYEGGRFKALAGKEKVAMWEVNREMAKAYCAWAGKRLPVYSEFDVAAHVGPSGKRTKWTWGDDWQTGMMNCSEDDCRDGIDEAAPPGSLHDTSAWGAVDMEGNVEEQVLGCAGHCPLYVAGTNWYDLRNPDAFIPLDVGGLRCARSSSAG